ncbi:helix-turn-helix domain-containing protein [Entomohabitans teleogrylli]|uniref:helix-turn-helix domain-containing protein n=1 Tax=Entomohabitans teleogrylli TaxID=1384589 RepID=UPI00073DB1AF|nr:helix-turn-helix transcriptional regulator [Entomohabitans teleogrylli]
MKGITLDDLRKEMLDTPEAVRGYEEADKELMLLQMLYDMRERAGLSKTDIARRLNIEPSAITRLEKNPLGASVKTLSRYAAACGAKIDIKALY